MIMKILRRRRIRSALAFGGMIGLVLPPVSAVPGIADDYQANRIHIEYVPPENPDLRPLYDLIRQRQVLEKLQKLFSPLELPVELTIQTKECGISNSWYARPTVTLCYEYIRDLADSAPKETSEGGITPMDAVAGQFLFTASHEMGHAVFDLLDVPLWGGTEEAADQFAAYILLRIGKQDASKLIEGAAYMYKQYVEHPDVTVPVTAFADIHGAPMQRLYNLLCISYGADPDMFSNLVQRGFLPQARAHSCRAEYDEVNFAFQKTIEPHVDQKLKAEVLSEDWVPPPNTPPPSLSDKPRAPQAPPPG
jgi:Putative metallopeptidase